MFQLYASVLLI